MVEKRDEVRYGAEGLKGYEMERREEGWKDRREWGMKGEALRG